MTIIFYFTYCDLATYEISLDFHWENIDHRHSAQKIIQEFILVRCMFSYLRTLRGGMADTFPTGCGPGAGGIMTSRPMALEPEERLGLTVVEATLAGLRGRGLWGGQGAGLDGCSETR